MFASMATEICLLSIDHQLTLGLMATAIKYKANKPPELIANMTMEIKIILYAYNREKDHRETIKLIKEVKECLIMAMVKETEVMVAMEVMEDVKIGIIVSKDHKGSTLSIKDKIIKMFNSRDSQI